MVADLDILGPAVVYRVFGESDSALIIGLDGYLLGSILKTEFIKKAAYLEGLFSCF